MSEFPSDDVWSLLRVTVPWESAELLIDDLLARGAAAVEEIAASGGTVVLRTSLGAGEVVDGAIRDLRERFPDATVVAEDVPRSVADTWRDHAESVRVDNELWLVPAWVAPPAGARHVVLVEPFDTFGLGNHPTTVMALRLARRHVAPGSRVHDHGAGSGVIAVALAATHQCRVSVDDIHPGSAAAVLYNADLNRVAPPVVCDALPVGPVDAVIANILAPVLRDHAVALCRAVEPGGVIVLSGLRSDQYESVVSRYASCSVIETETIDGWVAVALRRL